MSAWPPAHLAGPATTAKYRSILRNHILPAFGDHRLDAITHNEVKAFARDLAGRPSPTTVRRVVTLLGIVLRDAIDEHYLFFDPTARLRLRDRPGKPRPTVTPAQVWRIAQRMPDPQSRMLVFTAAYTGTRFGELAGLRRCNVHLGRAVIHVTADTGALHEVSGDRWLGPPKTKAAVRDIRLPPFLVDGSSRPVTLPSSGSAQPTTSPQVTANAAVREPQLHASEPDKRSPRHKPPGQRVERPELTFESKANREAFSS